MKIIGTAQAGNFLLLASEHEVAHLIGYKYPSQAKSQGGVIIEPGLVVQVSEMFDQLYQLQNKRRDLSKMAKQLREVADLLVTTEPIINAARGDNEE